MKWAPLLAAAVLAGACGAASAEESWPRDLGLEGNAPILALPAAAGAIVDLHQRLTGDSLTQTIVYQGDPLTPGQNVLVTSVLRGGLAPPIPSEDVDSEMEDRLPGIAMNVSLYPGRNVFGVFGYALGARGPVACLYAWQGVTNADVWITGRAASLFGEHHALSMRIRVCRTGMRPAALVGLAQGLVRAAMTRARTANHGACCGLFANVGGCCMQPFPVATAAPEERAYASQEPAYAPEQRAYAPQEPAYAPEERAYAPAAMPIARPPTPVRQATHRPINSRKAAPTIDAKSIKRQPEPAKPLEGMPSVPMPQ